MKKLTALAAILCAFTFSACNADAAKTAKAAEPTTEEQKTQYALGIFLSQQVDVFALTPEELVMVQKGFADGVNHAKPVVDPEAYKPKLQAFAQARMETASKKAAEAGTAYLDKASKETGATKTASGMVIKHTQEGSGAQPKATDQVKVHYEGRLIDGKVFDSSKERGEPATFPLNGVIPCWTEGVQTMKVGGKAQFVCPANLAYGPNGSPPTIPPQSTLVFDVELLDIVKAP
ncbi:MAG TPA: FKBP-type peptidyl-prolyl cis-trans isomerase [Steroidobacteraceae bacterium]|jgi:FKBP-type peptidyl-prolyl cis-trans isomerase|nr:FKBP-type peptidyl-prolyl cis-trans isomerase [Steroidobacteraceae bacterium]